MNYLLLILLSIIGGILYRLGGIGKPWNTKVRDLGVPVCGLFAMKLLGFSYSWPLFISSLLLFPALTTYWKKINRFFGDTDENCHWYNWLVHGLICGLAYLPMLYVGISLGTIIGRAIVLAIATMWWSEKISKVKWEEGGRGFLIIISLFMLGGIKWFGFFLFWGFLLYAEHLNFTGI